MNDLEPALARAFADTHAFYIKSHGYHWNVVGANFYQFHSFFEVLYSEVYGVIDEFAEHVRASGFMALGSYGAFKTAATIQDDDGPNTITQMVENLYRDNQLVLSSLYAAYSAANTAGEIGLANFLQDRYDTHKKHAWMLKSTLTATI